MSLTQQIDPTQDQKAPVSTGHQNNTSVALDKIDYNHRTQLRCKLNKAVVKTYAQEMKEGAVFPSVILFSSADENDEKYFVGDGHHRIEAIKKNEGTEVEAEIKPGGYRDALIYAAGANDQHGLRMTRKDKQNAIRVLLKDPNFCIKSDREISKIVHVDGKTVGSVRSELEASAEIPQVDKREVIRNGQSYMMDVKKDEANDSVDPARDKEGDNEILSPDELPLYDLVFAELDTIQKSKNIFRKLSTRIVKGGFLLVAVEQSDVPALFKMVDKSLTYFWMFSLPCNQEINKGKAKITSQWKPVLVWYKVDPGARQFNDFIFSNGDHRHFDYTKFYQMLLADIASEGDRLGVIVSDDHPIFRFGEDYKCRVESIEIKESKTMKSE